ncbi:hypothetical protein SMC26_44505 [Actinomadura fulvescens]
MAALRLSVPRVCTRKMTVKFQGRTVIMSNRMLTKTQLPDLRGAEVTGTRLTMAMPDAGVSAYTTWVNARSGRLVMAMAFMGTDAGYTKQNKTLAQAWARAVAAVR